MKTRQLIKQPVITEKSMKDAGKGVYTFHVSLAASKPAIKEAIEKAFSVHVEKVTTNIKKPKKKQVGRRRITSYTSAKKIARVWLKKDEKIDLFEFEE